MKRTSFFHGISRLTPRLSYALLALFIIFLTSKAFYLPLAFITSTSDNEVSRQWDLLIGVAGYISKPSNGSRVVLCRAGYWNTACLCGTAVANGNGLSLKSNGQVYAFKANGDANGGAVYVIVAAAPREIWIPAIAASVGASAILTLRNVRRGLSSFRRSLDPAISLSMLVLLLNALVTGSLYVAQEGKTYALPGLEIRKSFDPVASALRIEISRSGPYNLIGASCRLGERAPGGLANEQLDIEILENDTIIARIPLKLYEAIYNEGADIPHFLPIGVGIVRSAIARCNLLFREGNVTVSAVLETEWRDLVISEREDEVIIANPNPVDMAARVVIYDIKKGAVLEDLGLVIGRFSEARIGLQDRSGTLAVYVYYKLLGLERSRVLYIDRTA